MALAQVALPCSHPTVASARARCKLHVRAGAWAVPRPAIHAITSKKGTPSPLGAPTVLSHTAPSLSLCLGEARSLSSARRDVACQALSLPPLAPVQGPWGVWFALVFAGFFGIWSERTRLGKELSGAIVSTLVGMFLANVGILPAHAPELSVVHKFLLPLAIPMLLFSANLMRIVNETGRLLFAFLLGSAATVAGTMLAWQVFPLGPYLGGDGWKVAAALTARHIGGAVNYMAVSDSLSISPSIFGAGLAADDLILAFYFTTIYTLANKVPPDEGGGEVPAGAGGGAGGGGHVGGSNKTITVPEALGALSLSALICYVASHCAAACGAPGQTISIITGITVALATLLPRTLAPLIPSAEGLAQLLMQVFYASIGASANLGLVIKTAPVLFLFSFLALAAHLGILLGVGRLLGFSRRELLIASNANIGGPPTVAGMTAAKGWKSSIVPGILTSTCGYAIGTFIGLALGQNWLNR